MWGSVEPAVREFTNHNGIILNNRAPCSWVSQIQINSKSFPDVARCIQHETCMCSCNDLWRRVLFKQKGGTGGMGGCTQRLQTEWPSLGSALGVPWLVLSGPLLSSYARTGWENSLHPVRCPLPVGKPFSQSGWAVASWVMTIASSLMGGVVGGMNM